MKRYDLEDTSYCGRGEMEMVEEPEGEWVKWEDVKTVVLRYAEGKKNKANDER